MNLSLGSPFDATVYGCGFSPVCAELRRLWRSGVLVVVASGNEGVVEVSTPSGEIELNAALSIGDPANLEDCIAVGSVHSDRPHLYGISSFSSRGPTADGRLKPDVVAPGERIASCNAGYRKAGRGTWYRTDSGTSMAAPHVSGMLAAFLSVRRELRGRPDEVKELLLRTATDIGRDRYHQGHGIPNLMRIKIKFDREIQENLNGYGASVAASLFRVYHNGGLELALSACVRDPGDSTAVLLTTASAYSGTVCVTYGARAAVEGQYLAGCVYDADGLPAPMFMQVAVAV